MHACVDAIQTVVSTLCACIWRSLQITCDSIKGLQRTNGLRGWAGEEHSCSLVLFATCMDALDALTWSGGGATSNLGLTSPWWLKLVLYCAGSDLLLAFSPAVLHFLWQVGCRGWKMRCYVPLLAFFDAVDPLFILLTSLFHSRSPACCRSGVFYPTLLSPAVLHILWQVGFRGVWAV